MTVTQLASLFSRPCRDNSLNSKCFGFFNLVLIHFCYTFSFPVSLAFYPWGVLLVNPFVFSSLELPFDFQGIFLVRFLSLFDS